MPKIAKPKKTLLAVDVESTGLNFYHGCSVFFLTTCDQDGAQQFWEWDVCPHTREPAIPQEDLAAIRALLHADELVGHNVKFDVTGLAAIGVDDWPWAKTHDTIIAAHLLNSAQPKDLGALAVMYLGEDLAPYEDALAEAVKECRKEVQQAKLRARKGKGPQLFDNDEPLANWRIADEGDPYMPSTGKEIWRADYWLPRAMVRHCALNLLTDRLPDSDQQPIVSRWQTASVRIDRKTKWGNPFVIGKDGDRIDVIKKYAGWILDGDGRHLLNDLHELHSQTLGCHCSPDTCHGDVLRILCHPWWTILAEYSNKDSETTLLLWQVMRAELERQGLWELYVEKVKNLTVLRTMERRGTTVHQKELAAMRDEYLRDIETCNGTCLAIAKARKYDLKLPKSGNNKSLSEFAFDVLGVPAIKYTDRGAPSLDKEVIEEYKKTLEGQQLRFITNLSATRKRAKSCEFLGSYSSFGIPGPGEILVLHPSVNATATATTRLSMSYPNLQQVSKQESLCDTCHGEGCDKCGGTGEDLHSVRKVFGPGPGREWWSADAKNIELRIPAFESGEKSLIELFERPDDPPFYGSQHMLNMSIVHNDIWDAELKAVGIDKVGPHCKKKYGATYYHWAKGGGLAMQYQCGEATADRAFRNPGGFHKLKSYLKKLDKLNEKYVNYANQHGYIETLPDKSLGCKRGYPLVCSRGDYGRISPTVPLNYHVQGSAGWWMVRAMNRCQELLDQWRAQDGFDGYICLTVHDELVFDFPQRDPARDIAQDKSGKGAFRTSNFWRARKIQAAMSKGGDDIGIPTPVSLSYHAHNWAEGLDI